MKELERIKSIVFGIFGVIIVIISIRIGLAFIGANPSTPFVQLWNSLSGIFVNSWQGALNDIKLSGNSVVEVGSLFAIFFYITLIVLVDRILDHFEFDNSSGIRLGVAIIDSIFKFIELILGLRFFFKIINANTASTIVRFVYGMSDFIINPFRGIVGDFRFESIVVEISTLLILIIFIAIDAASDMLLKSLLKKVEE